MTGATGRRLSWRALLALLAVAGVVALLVRAYATSEKYAVPEPDPTPTSTPLTTRASTPGPLDPPLPTHTDLEDTPEVQALRHDTAVHRWAHMNALCKTAEYQALVDDDYYGCAILYSISSKRPWSAIGPTPFTPLALHPTDDGGAHLQACVTWDFGRWVYVDSLEPYAGQRYLGELRPAIDQDKRVATYYLTPLSADEHAAAVALGLDPPAFRVRRETIGDERCDDTDVTVQTFTDWRQTALFHR